MLLIAELPDESIVETELPAGRPVTVGRGLGSEVVIPDSAMSNVHFRIAVNASNGWLRASNRMTHGRDGADFAAGQGASDAGALGVRCAKPARRRNAAKDARPFGLRLKPASSVSGLLAVPDPGTGSEPFLASIRPEAQRGSRGILLEALRDLSSWNGTYVNGSRVSDATIGPGDLIQAGNSRIRLGFAAADA